MTPRTRIGANHRHRFVVQGRSAIVRPDRSFVEYFVCPVCYAVKRRTYRIVRTRIVEETIVVQEPSAAPKGVGVDP